MKSQEVIQFTTLLLHYFTTSEIEKLYFLDWKLSN